MTIPLGTATTNSIVTDPLNIPATGGTTVSEVLAWPNDEPITFFQVSAGLATIAGFNSHGPFSAANIDVSDAAIGVTIGESYWGGVYALGGSDLPDGSGAVIDCYFKAVGGVSGMFTVANPYIAGSGDQNTTANIGPLGAGFGGFIWMGPVGGPIRQYLIDYTNQTISQAFTGPDNTFVQMWWNSGADVVALNKQGTAMQLTTFTPTALGAAFSFTTVALDYDNPAITALLHNSFIMYQTADSFVIVCTYDATGNPMPNPIFVVTKKDLSSYDTITLSAGDPAVTALINDFVVNDAFDLYFAPSTVDAGTVYFASGPTSSTIFTGIVGALPPSAPPYIPPPALYRLPCYQVCQPLYIGRN